MILATLSIVGGLTILMWSAGRFVDGAAAAAGHFKIPPLLIGMVVVGFGTSAPEMAVSAIAAYQGNAGIALGNAYGSNITNIALILGLSAVISPIAVHSMVLRKELPVLAGVTVLAAILLVDDHVSRLDAILLLVVFVLLLAWAIRQGLQKKDDSFGKQVEGQVESDARSLRRSIIWIVVGLVLLVSSSRLLVWGAVEIARALKISDLIIGLTIVAVGTSLPELASTIVAARRKQHDLALGNILGSNLFNTLAVVGVAGVISPLTADPSVFTRHIMMMAVLTVSLFAIGYGFRKPGRVSRLEGWALLICYLAYALFLVTP